MSVLRGDAGDVRDESGRGVDAAERFLLEHRDELLAFAAELVATPSPNPPGDESLVAELVARRLEALGASEVTILAPAEKRHNVLATFAGDGDGPVLLLNGHLDTKPPGDLAAWHTPPFEPTVRDGMLIGSGACDMKAAVAAITYAAGRRGPGRHAGARCGSCSLPTRRPAGTSARSGSPSTATCRPTSP